MADTTNFYGTDGDDLIDFSKRPLSQLSYSVGRAGKGNDTIYLTSGKWAVGGSGDDTITSIGYGIFGVKYDESTKGISLDALKGTVVIPPFSTGLKSRTVMQPWPNAASG